MHFLCFDNVVLHDMGYDNICVLAGSEWPVSVYRISTSLDEDIRKWLGLSLCKSLCIWVSFESKCGSLKTFSFCCLTRYSWAVVTMSCTGEQRVSLWLPTLPNRFYWRTLPSQVFIHHSYLCTTSNKDGILGILFRCMKKLTL